ncbi:DUF4239 domain-containing protein [Salinifilum aidingensis]
MQSYVVGVVWVLAAAGFGALCAYFVRRLGNEEGRLNNNEAAGQVFTIVSGLQAVVLGFILVTLFDTADDARQGAYREAQNLVAVSWAVEPLSPGVGAEVRTRSAEYARTVLDEEWPRMRAGEPLGDRGWQQLDAIRRALGRVAAEGEWAANRRGEAAGRLASVYEERQQRITRAADRDVVAVMWFVLIGGSFACVLLPNLFGGTRLGPHVLLVSTLAGVMALLLFAIFQLQNPFGGSRIPPEAFRWALGRLGTA